MFIKQVKVMDISPKARRSARMFAMQAMYQWQINGGSVPDLMAQYMSTNAHRKVDWDFFQALVKGVAEQVHGIDDKIAPLTDRNFKDVNPVELAILRVAIFELAERLDVPYKVVINEYIDIAHEFGAEEGHKFVNGILDKLARQLRAIEVGAEK